MTEFFSNTNSVLYTILCCSSICSILTSLEWLFLNKEFKRSGLYSWEIIQIRVLKNKSQFQKRLLTFLFRYPNVIFIFFIQLILSFSIFFLFNHPLLIGFAALGVVICYFLITYRKVEGFNGGDSMAKVVFLTCSLCFLQPSRNIQVMGLAYISVQLIIAYLTPGILRITDKKWLNGEKLMLVLRMETFSKKSVYNFFKSNPVLSKATSISLILFEVLFIFSLILPIEYLLIFLIFGALFHLLNAIIMGLNTFVWSFIGSYPAIVWSSIELHKLINNHLHINS